ncbi:hypothetical protein JOE40_001300 [Arthrobacter sp. PvP102]|uniref:hypothetical protein n=1 Tax=unclassified Arthrobacter TaxID=235627 RepID=UPI001AE578F8|nr:MULTISPECIES: hypothetical protein [unclassified Arthrobacter]MBP1231656.1 hypothetical protein [Arthrobacter sp. PvP103]MBP1236791.1 hypothetical protein [Arthrobacter sp. PvP102]
MQQASSINWRTISENDFNKIVESLIVRDRTKNGLIAQAVDGRGGDGGTDIDVRVERTGQVIEILQLKWFPEGFSNHFKARKTQIKKSFESAMSEAPPVWTLVIPANLTPNERKSVFALRKGRKVIIRFVDETNLNLLLADHPEVHDWATRDVARQALEIVARDSASMSKPRDLALEATRLHDKANGTSAYWGRNWAVTDGVVTEVLYAKRPDAPQREPLSFVVETEFGPDDAALGREFTDSLSYGVMNPIVLPSHVVTSFTKVGPEWFAEEVGPGELRIFPSGDSKRKLRVQATTLDSGDRRLSNISGNTSHVTSGTTGVAVQCSFPGGIGQRWRFPSNRSEPGRVDISFSPEGSSARDIRRSLTFMESLESATKVALVVDGVRQVLSLPGLRPTYELDPALLELIDDLAYIEDHLDVTFEFPSEIPNRLQRVWIRTVRRMLEGRCVVLPNSSGFDATLSGELDEGLETVLSEQGSAIAFNEEDWTLNVLGEELLVGSMGIYHQRIRVDGAEEHLKSLRAGRGGGRKMHMRPVDGSPFRIYSPARMGPDDAVVAEPWGLTGIPEHENFDALASAPGSATRVD